MKPLHVSKNPLENALDAGLHDYILKNMPPLDVSKEIELDLFDQVYRSKRPILIEGATDHWPSRKWDFEFFRSRYGSLNVSANNFSESPIKMTLAEVIDSTDSANGKAGSTYLQEWKLLTHCPELIKDIRLPKYFDSNDRELGAFGIKTSYSLWLGPAGTNTYLHFDANATSVWNLQIQGSKQWILLSPAAKNVRRDFRGMEMDPIEYMKTPENRPVHCTTRPGDLLYVPMGWWHRVRSLSPAINLSTNFVEKINIPNFVHELRVLCLIGWLSQDLLLEKDPGLQKIFHERARAMALNMGADPNDILGLKTDDPCYSPAELLRKLKIVA